MHTQQQQNKVFLFIICGMFTCLYVCQLYLFSIHANMTYGGFNNFIFSMDILPIKHYEPLETTAQIMYSLYVFQAFRERIMFACQYQWISYPAINYLTTIRCNIQVPVTVFIVVAKYENISNHWLHLITNVHVLGSN